MRHLVLTAIAALSFSACASPKPLFDPALDDPEKIIRELHRDDPTIEHPKVGCIAPSLSQRSRVGTVTVDGRTYEGKRLPEIVRIIGMTSIEDGERWMVVRGVYSPDDCADIQNRTRCNWQPFERSRIQFAGCGREADAIRGMTASDVRPRSPADNPPNR